MLSLLALAPLALAPSFADAPEKEPGPKSMGKVYTWTAENGMQFEYFVPKDYDPEVGANLTLVLHGSNLDRRWGFANHRAGDFREDDIVVCPDGTTPNGNGGFNSLQGQDDLEKLHALHEELLETFNVKATFLYGHSQGSFFAFYYAGAYPDDVQGLVGQASGVWIGTQAGKKQHHQAICLMHGTQDPVVPYGQSVGGYEFYEEAKYPHLHLRSLEDWNHWPAQAQTEMQLAWCEAMTTEDPARLVACFEVFDDSKQGVDPSAFYDVARRTSTFEGVPARTAADAKKAMKEIEETAEDHVASITKSLGKDKPDVLDDASWVGHVPRFLRSFQGVPACVELEKEWRRVLEKSADNAAKGSKEWWRLVEKKPADAFEAGVELIRTGFLSYQAENEERLKQLETWHDDAKKLKLKKSLLQAYDETVPVFRSATEKGKKAFQKCNGSRFG